MVFILNRILKLNFLNYFEIHHILLFVMNVTGIPGKKTVKLG